MKRRTAMILSGGGARGGGWGGNAAAPAPGGAVGGGGVEATLALLHQRPGLRLVEGGRRDRAEDGGPHPELTLAAPGEGEEGAGRASRPARPTAPLGRHSRQDHQPLARQSSATDSSKSLNAPNRIRETIACAATARNLFLLLRFEMPVFAAKCWTASILGG